MKTVEGNEFKNEISQAIEKGETTYQLNHGHYAGNDPDVVYDANVWDKEGQKLTLSIYSGWEAERLEDIMVYEGLSFEETYPE
jgi:hypothetical protein